MDVNINPLSKAIGAEILGVDLSEKVDSEDLFHIYLATPWSNTSLIL